MNFPKAIALHVLVAVADPFYRMFMLARYVCSPSFRRSEHERMRSNR